jgi:heme O synthase-like polyprenyltransferase
VQFGHLTKPRVVSLIVFTAVIGMLLASPACRRSASVAATVGIALVAGRRAAFNCLVEQKIDAVMARTRGAADGDGHHLPRADPAAGGAWAGWASRSCGTR